MILNVKLSLVIRITIFSSLCLSACRQEGATQAVVNPTAATESAAVQMRNAILYRGDPGRSGVYDEPAPDAFTEVKWQRSFDEDAYFPMYANETLYIGTASGKLLALDPESGDERWSYSTGNGPILAVAVAGDLVYFGAGDHGFYAVDTQDGELAWSFETDGSVWSSSPLIIGDRAYFGSDTGMVYALDLTTHEAAWTFKAASGVLSQVASDLERVYVPTQNVLYALDLETGTEAWRATTEDKWNAPAAANRIVYAGKGSRQFVALDAENGSEQWTFTAPPDQWSEWSAPVVTEDMVYAGYSSNTMYAFQAATGEVQWQFETEDWATTDPVLADGILYFGVGAHANLAESTEDRLFYALEAATGEPAWTFRGNGLVYSAAALGNGVIYFKTLNNMLYAIH